MISKRIAIAVLAWATTAVASAAVESDTISLAEVTVSAVKQGVGASHPIASTFISSAEAGLLGAESVKGFSDVAPNFFVPDYGSRITSSIYVRGLGSRMDQPVVGLIVDNVPFLNKDAYDFDLVDIAGCEIIRGPQSVLYGRNTMCGVINISTLSPMRFQGVKGQLEYGKHNALKLSAGVYRKLNSKSGVSATVSFGRSDGWQRNRYNNARTGAERQASARLKYIYRPSSSFSLQNTLAGGYSSQSGYPYQSVATGEINYNDTCFYRRFTLNDGLTLNLTGEKVSLTSVTSVQYIDDNMTLDQDFLPADYFTLTQKKRETGLTQDILLRPSDQTSKYTWLAGAFAFYKHMDMHAPVTFLDTGIRSLIEDHRNNANPDYPISWDSRSFTLGSRFTNPVYGMALYHRSKLDLGALSLMAGIRADYEKATLRYNSSCATGYTILQKEAEAFVPFRHVNINIDDHGTLGRDFLQLLPSVSALYSFTGLPSSNIYINLSKGYKSGGFNTQMFSEVLQQRLMRLMGIGPAYNVDDIVGYKPEKSWNLELGSHLTTTDLRLSADLAAFWIDCRDQQLTVFPPGSVTGRMMTNAGRTRSLGAELTLRYNPVAALNFTLSYGHTDARFRSFRNGGENYRGKRIPYAPANTLFAQASYKLKLNAKHLSHVLFSADAKAAGPIYWNESNTLRQPFYATLRASVTLSNKHISLRLWGNNLTGTRYYTFYFISMGNEFLQLGRPIDFGATLNITI